MEEKNIKDIGIDEVVKNYEPLISSIINKKKIFLEGLDYQDMLQEGRFALFNAIKTFDLDKKVNFSVYAEKIICNHYINLIRKNNNQKNSPLNTALNINNQGEVDFGGDDEKKCLPIKSNISIENDYIENEKAKLLIDEMVSKLSCSESKVFQLKLNYYTNKEIAKELNVKEKAVDNALTRIKRKFVKIKG